MRDGTPLPKDVDINSSWVREAVDPNNTLPKVNLDISPDNIPARGTLIFTKYDVANEGNVIGELTVNTNKIQKTAWTNRVNINEELRGKGYGLSAYVTAIEMCLKEGITFRTHDWSQTAEAKRVWEILADKGVATVVEPFTPDGTGRYNGHYEVRPR